MADQFEWELSKENIQPLRHGRNISILSTTLAEDGAKRSRNEQRKNFELEIMSYEGDDPLDLWSCYISWVDESYPDGGKDGDLLVIVEKCLEKLRDMPVYQSDQRLLSVYLRYFDLTERNAEWFQMLYASGYFRKLADFYINWAEFVEDSDHKAANKIYQVGFENGCEPLQKIQDAHKKFQARVTKALFSGTAPRSNPVDNENRQVFGELTDEGGLAVVRSGTSVQRFQNALLMPTKKVSGNRHMLGSVHVDREGVDNTGPAFLAPIKTGFQKISSTKVENVQKPSKWTEARTTINELVQAPPKPKLQVLTDEEDGGHRKTDTVVMSALRDKDVAPSKWNPQSLLTNGTAVVGSAGGQGSKERLMCDLTKLYVAKKEFSFEEIRRQCYERSRYKHLQPTGHDSSSGITRVARDLACEPVAILVAAPVSASNPVEPGPLTRSDPFQWLKPNERLMCGANVAFEEGTLHGELSFEQYRARLNRYRQPVKRQREPSPIRPTVQSTAAENLPPAKVPLKEAAQSVIVDNFSAPTPAVAPKVTTTREVEVQTEIAGLDQELILVPKKKWDVSVGADEDVAEEAIPVPQFAGKVALAVEQEESVEATTSPTVNTRQMGSNLRIWSDASVLIPPRKPRMQPRTEAAKAPAFNIFHDSQVGPPAAAVARCRSPRPEFDFLHDSQAPDIADSIARDFTCPTPVRPMIPEQSFQVLQEQHSLAKFSAFTDCPPLPNLCEDDEELVCEIPAAAPRRPLAARKPLSAIKVSSDVEPELSQAPASKFSVFSDCPPLPELCGVDDNDDEPDCQVAGAAAFSAFQDPSSSSQPAKFPVFRDCPPLPELCGVDDDDESEYDIAAPRKPLAPRKPPPAIKVYEEDQPDADDFKENTPPKCGTSGEPIVKRQLSGILVPSVDIEFDPRAEHPESDDEECPAGAAGAGVQRRALFAEDDDTHCYLPMASTVDLTVPSADAFMRNCRIQSTPFERGLTPIDEDNTSVAFNLQRNPNLAAGRLSEFGAVAVKKRGLSPISELSRECFSSSGGSSAGTTTLAYSCTKVVPKNCGRVHPCNYDPFDMDVRKKLLASARPLESVRGYNRISGRLPTLRATANVNLCGRNYQVEKVVGKGAYAKIYVATDCSTGRRCVLKVQDEAGCWDFYILAEIADRLPAERPLASVVGIDAGYFYDNGSVLVNECLAHGTLLDLVNYYKKQTVSMPESLVFYMSLELLAVTEQLHRRQIIHADIKADNVMFSNSISEPADRWTVNAVLDFASSCSGSVAAAGINGVPILKVIDFGRSLDMSLYSSRTSFTHCFQKTLSPEMMDSKPWNYQLDYFGLATTIYCMLMGVDRKIVYAGSQWMVGYLKRGHNSVWRDLTTALLNAPSDGLDLSEWRRRLGAEFASSTKEREFQDRVREMQRILLSVKL